MSVNLRDRLFSDTGGFVQNATVQAILVTGGGTDVGTSSVVQATTTSDVNGMWKFAALPDPGAGNWYDVKITNGNQVRWRYGNIQAAIQQILLTSSVSVSGSLTAATTVTAGTGLTVSAGGAAITGNSTVTGTLTATAGFGVSAGGANITGNVAISAGNLTISAGGLRVHGDPGAAAGTLGITDSNGVGNGALTNMQAPAFGTGSGPVNPLAVVTWIKVYEPGGATRWFPLFV